MGLPMAPQNAAVEVKGIAKFVSDHNGGSGAVRDAVEYILKAQNLMGFSCTRLCYGGS